MDIEGSEYELLLHLYKKNVLHLIDQLAIEQHPDVSPFKTPLDIFDFIINESGVKLLKWV